MGCPRQLQIDRLAQTMAAASCGTGPVPDGQLPGVTEPEQNRADFGPSPALQRRADVRIISIDGDHVRSSSHLASVIEWSRRTSLQRQRERWPSSCYDDQLLPGNGPRTGKFLDSLISNLHGEM